MSSKLQKQNKLINNTFWFSIGVFSSKAINFLLVPLYTNILTTAEYSIADIISTTVSLMIPFFTLLVTSAVFRYVIEKEGNTKEILSIGLFVILIGAIPLGMISFIVFQYVESIQGFWGYFYAMYLLSTLSTLFSEFLLGLEKVKITAVIGIIHTLSFTLCNILFLVVFRMNIEGYLMAYIISNIITVSLYFICGKIHEYIVNPFHNTKALWKKMIRYSLPMIPNSAMWWITNSSDRYFVLMMISASANGVLSVSYKIPSMLSVFISTFKSAWDLSVVDDFENENGKRFFKQVYQKYVEVTLIISSALILASKLLGYILYASDFFEAWKLSAVLIVGFAFHSISGFLGSAFTAAKETKNLFYSTLLGAVVNLIGNYFLIMWFGTVGAVIATGISYFLTMVYRRIAVRKYVEIKGDLIRNMLCFGLLMIEVGLVYVDQIVTFFIAAFIFIVICWINQNLFIGMWNILCSRLGNNVFNKIRRK